VSANESACKPDPVCRSCFRRFDFDDHPSGHTVAGYLEQSTRRLGRAALEHLRSCTPCAVQPSTLLRAGFT